MAAQAEHWTASLNEVDDHTASLLIQLQLNELEEAAAEAGDAQIEADGDLARNMFGEALRQYCQQRGLDNEPSQRAEAVQLLSPNISRAPCGSCLDHFPENKLNALPCEHKYCESCIRELFSQSLTDVTLYPPRCCKQPIPLDGPDGVRISLGTEVAREFDDKKEEMEDTAKVYCHQNTCSAYIPLIDRKNGKAGCITCKSVTCLACKGADHSGDCPSDAGVQEVLDLASQEGWQRYACANMSSALSAETGGTLARALCSTRSIFSIVRGKLPTANAATMSRTWLGISAAGTSVSIKAGGTV